VQLKADLALPQNARGLVIFVHGSGSSRRSPRNRRVAARLRAEGFGTLLFDLLTAEEERKDEVTKELRFDIPLLAERLEAVTRWLAAQARRPRPGAKELPGRVGGRRRYRNVTRGGTRRGDLPF
jgi:predicted alpha/beta-hydrolase family hydrolase